MSVLFSQIVWFIYDNTDEAPRDPAAQQRSIQTRLFRLRKGQSILDADPVPGLYILVKGDMKVQYVGRNGNKDSAPIIGRPRGGGNSMTVSSGHILGHVALFSGNSEEWYGRKGSKCPPAMTATVSSQDCWLIGVSINSYLRDLVNRPAVIFHVSNRLIDALPPMLRLFDFCTKWKKVDSGENIVVKGQAPTGELQVLLFGRLGVITSEKSGDLKVSPSTEYLWNSPTPTVDSTLRSAAPDHPNGGNRSIGSDEPVGEPDFLLGKGALIGEFLVLYLLRMCCNFCWDRRNSTDDRREFQVHRARHAQLLAGGSALIAVELYFSTVPICFGPYRSQCIYQTRCTPVDVHRVSMRLLFPVAHC